MLRLMPTCYNLVISAHSHLQVGHILPQLPSGGVDMHRSFRDGLTLSEFQVLHFSQYRGKLAKGGKKQNAYESIIQKIENLWNQINAV